MSTIPLPALQIRAPQPVNPIETYAQYAQLQNLMQTGQRTQLENEQMRRNLADADIWKKVLADPNWDGTPEQLLKNGLKAGAGKDSYLAMQKSMLAMKQERATLDETTLKNSQMAADQYRGRILSITGAPDDKKQALWEQEIAQEEKAGTVPPGALSKTYPGDEMATTLANHFALGSVLAKEAAEQKQADARKLTADTAAGKFAAEQNPQSPLYAPTPAATALGAQRGDATAQAIQAGEVQQASAKAGAEAKAKLPYELQLKQQELAQNPVFAVNPKTGQRELTTIGDAKTQGFTNPVKVSQSDLEHETTLNSQLNDLQLNTSRYKAALNAMGPLSKADVANMARVLSDKSINSFLANELTLGVAIDQVSQGEKASAWNALSPDKQQALIGSLRMKNSALLFQKVSTGMGRASKEAMDIEIANMPSPIEGATVGNQKLQSFQENIDQMASRSVKLPWQERSQDVKARIEGQAADQYNQQQATKPQGQYRAKSPVTVGQNIQIPNVPGLSRVKKVYPDGTFDADQK